MKIENPLLLDWATPFNTPPFEIINTSHFKPAIEEAISIAEKEIREINDNTDLPTFKNTVEKLEMAGDKLGRITSVLFNLNNAETTKDLQKITQEVSPLLTRFSNDITLNARLFNRIAEVYKTR
ncbi:MAG TPA: hypothetical protein VJ963_11715, partial [Bacteroidales bacterium]|nr:hypothetical protein [Bacteroidales bacterium]